MPVNDIPLRWNDPQKGTSSTMSDDYPRTGKTLYLNIIWHQHQPLYLDPGSDQLQGPWVRSHGTKDYYDTVSMLLKYPDVHFTVNLTSSLLFQLEEYYVRRLKPCIDLRKNRVDAKKYFATYGGRTDPWIDLALKPTRDFDARDLQFLLTNNWNAFGVSEVVIGRFPEYRALRDKFKRAGVQGLTEQDRREIKFWFYLAYFDPDFLGGKMKLASGATIDLTDLITKNDDGTYKLATTVTEDGCNRIVAETYKVLEAIIPIHRKLMYRPSTGKGQIEIITTPYYHPILPLVYDSDLAKLCQPNEPMPKRFHFPRDAEAQVARAVAFYKEKFGLLPRGMWPAEGAVAYDVVPVFAKHGIRWIATDEKILARSRPSNLPKFYPYRVAGDGVNDAVIIVFRDTELSDKIGFVYQHFGGEEAADDFVKSVLNYVPREEEQDRLLTVILDGENAWEWYRYDNDGKVFQHALYRKLSKLHGTRQVVTTTLTEYVHGNPSRGVPPHPPESMAQLEWLWPGSWINANYDTWIGEEEDNRAWDYLLTARQDLEASGLPRPDGFLKEPKKGSQAWYAYRAWESMYAAEGSDWFWWYETRQTAPSGDKPFDIAYITHLNNVYSFAKLAKARMPERRFQPIIHEAGVPEQPAGGAMAQSREDLVTVVFQVDCKNMYVRRSIYIVGNHELLGSWVPNRVKMYDDGTHGDTRGDDVWTLELQLPAGAEIQYKFTNSGAEGSWDPGDELPGAQRTFRVSAQPGARQMLLDRFGRS